MQSNIVFCQEQAGLGRDGEFFSYFIWQDNDEVWIDSQFYGFHHLLGPSVARWRRRCEEREGEWYQRRAHQKEETCELFIVWNWKHGGGPSTRRGSCPCANCCRPPTVVGSGPVHGFVHSPSFRTPPGVGVVDHSKKNQALTKTNTHKDSPRPSAAARSTARLRRRHRPQIPPGPLPAIGSVFRWVAPLTPRQLSMS